MKRRLTRKHTIRTVGATFLAVCVLMAAIWGVRHLHQASVKPEDPWYTVEGSIEGDTVDVSAKIPGRIAKIMVEEGAAVVAGDPLVYLESREIDAKAAQAQAMVSAAHAQAEQALTAVELQERTSKAQIRQAEAGLQAARAKLQMALTGARPQEVTQAEKAAEQANAAYETAESAFNRAQGLFQEGVISRQKQEEVELQYRSAKAARDAAQAKLSLVREGARQEEIEQARAGVRAAEAALRLAKEGLLQVDLRKQDAIAVRYKTEAARQQAAEATAYQDETVLRSPISGVISQRLVDAGELVSAGYPILSIVRNRDLKVKVYADETQFGHLRRNGAVDVVIPALNNQVVKGRILRIAPAADFATRKATNEMNSVDVRSIELTVVITDQHSELRDGMTARIRIPRAPSERP